MSSKYIPIYLTRTFISILSGTYRNWYAPSGYEHNISLTSALRFLPEPSEYDIYTNYSGRCDSAIPDCRGKWYYWKLKPWEVTPFTRLFVWLCYTGHQLSVWLVIYLAQLKRSEETGPKYGTNLNKYNYICLGLNVLFHVLHLVQTHITYDALAQDVVISSSQGSVIMLLVLVMLLQYTERGLFFGWPTLKHTGKVSARLRLKHSPIHLIRKFHGYGFAWAAIYTFWYHPMENTYGHALGFVHTWFFMLQGSLMYTQFHKNRWWRLLQEVWVALHGSLVAIQTGGPQLKGTSLWPMFLFGFLWLLALTQIFLLDFWNKIPWWTRIFPVLVCTGITIGNYAWIPDANGQTFVRIQEIVRIPAITYLSCIYAWAIMLFFEWVDTKVYGSQNRRNDTPINKVREIIHIIGFLLVYSLLVGISVFFQQGGAVIMMFVSMVVLIFVFITGVCVAIMCVKQIIPRKPTNTNRCSQDSLGNSGSNESIKKISPTDAVEVEMPEKINTMKEGQDNNAFSTEQEGTNSFSKRCPTGKFAITEVQVT